MATYEEFKKLEIKVANIKEVVEHPNADRLYIIKIDLGDCEKQIVAGIKNFYRPEDLVGRQVAVVANLEPITIRGAESQAMLLAASDENGISILIPQRQVKTGSIIK